MYTQIKQRKDGVKFLPVQTWKLCLPLAAFLGQTSRGKVTSMEWGMFDRGAVEGWDPKAKAMPVVGARALLFLFALPAHFRLKLRLLRSKVESSRVESRVSPGWNSLLTYIHIYLLILIFIFFFLLFSVPFCFGRFAVVSACRDTHNQRNKK